MWQRLTPIYYFFHRIYRTGGDTDQETFHNICHGQLDFPDELFEDISPQAEDFIRKTLSRDPRYKDTDLNCSSIQRELTCCRCYFFTKRSADGSRMPETSVADGMEKCSQPSKGDHLVRESAQELVICPQWRVRSSRHRNVSSFCSCCRSRGRVHQRTHFRSCRSLTPTCPVQIARGSL